MENFTIKSVATNKAPAALGPYSQAVEARDGKSIFVSGQIALQPGEDEITEENFSAQATQVFQNLFEIVRAADCNPSDIVKLTIFLTNLSYFDELNQIMISYFNEPFPARSTVQVSALPKGALIEIDAIVTK